MRPGLVTGARGMLGRGFVRLCAERHLAYQAAGRTELDITDARAIDAALERHEPWLVVNAAGYPRRNDAELDVARCYRANVIGPARRARACARRGIALITFSSDGVFDGTKRAPYFEADAPSPRGVYGRTQHAAESRVLAAHPGALIVRTSAVFGPWDDANFVGRVLAELAAGREVRAAYDAIISPTYVPDLIHACLDLAIDGEQGLSHLSNAGTVSWAELARHAAELAGHRVERVVPVACRELGGRGAAWPSFHALGSTRGGRLPPLADALRRYHHARIAHRAPLEISP
jgi:dTDP-4-dehydrorhamnose reductase